MRRLCIDRYFLQKMSDTSIPQLVGVYEKFYQGVYLELYERMQDLSRTIVRINNET